jgi:hypothetical protein
VPPTSAKLEYTYLPNDHCLHSLFIFFLRLTFFMEQNPSREVNSQSTHDIPAFVEPECSLLSSIKPKAVSIS